MIPKKSDAGASAPAPLVRRLWPRIALGALSSLLAFIVGLTGYSALVLAGFINPHPMQLGGPAVTFDSELGWAPKPFYRARIDRVGMVTTNSLGFRSSELDSHRDKIVILGDSVAWGYGVDDTETLSSRLQDKLSGRRLQVVNMAVAGYGPDQEYLWLKRNVSNQKVRGGVG
jgi:hypothetical protein